MLTKLFKESILTGSFLNFSEIDKTLALRITGIDVPTRGDLCFRVILDKKADQETIYKHLSEKLEQLGFIEQVETKNGFLNIHLTDTQGSEMLLNALNSFNKPEKNDKSVYVDYIGPNMKTNMNLGVIRNAFLGDFVSNALSLKYKNVYRGATVCDIGERADIMMYMRTTNPTFNQSFYHLYQRYLSVFNEQATQMGIQTVIHQTDPHAPTGNKKLTITFDERVPVCQAVKELAKRLTKEDREKIVAEFTTSFLADLDKLGIGIQNCYYHSHYKNGQRNYLNLDVEMITQLHEQGIDDFYYVFGQDQEAHLEKLSQKIRTIFPETEFNSLFHQNVSSGKDTSATFKQRDVFSVLDEIQKKNNCSYPIALLHLKKTYLAVAPLTEISWSDKFEKKLFDIQSTTKLIHVYNRLNQKNTRSADTPFSQADKKLALIALNFQKCLQDGITSMRPDSIVNALDKFVSNTLQVLKSHTPHPKIQSALCRTLNTSLNILGAPVNISSKVRVPNTNSSIQIKDKFQEIS